MKNIKVAALVSGGVDSAVALRILKDQGCDITAFYLKIWLEDELAYLGNCPWQEDLHFVQAVCEQAGVPLQVLSFQKEYHEQVVKETLKQIEAGCTPNPDILCNQRVKFGAFYQAVGDQFDAIATGHYAQRVDRDGIAFLKQSPDRIKDQTYFLAGLSQDQLKRALFPIGHLEKWQVRQLAQDYNLPNKDRKDSQGICFLGKIKFDDFLRHHLGENPGPIIEFETDKILGQHKGFWYHTIGQRKGLGLGGGPWYVVKKDSAQNKVYVSAHYYEDDKIRDTFRLVHGNWISKPMQTGYYQMKLRHGETMYNAHLLLDDEHSGSVHLINANDQGIASGQSAVFYDADGMCLGSGIITELPHVLKA